MLLLFDREFAQIHMVFRSSNEITELAEFSLESNLVMILVNA